MRGADQRIAADADAGALPQSGACQLIDRFIGERAALRDDADAALFADVVGDDAGLAFTGRDDAGTVRTNQPRAGMILQEGHRLQHVHHRNAFGDAHDKAEAGIRRLHNRVGGKRRRHEDHRRVGAGLFHRIGHGVEHRPAFVGRAAFARRDAAHHLGVIGLRGLGVERALAAGQSLNDQARVVVEQDCHQRPPGLPASATTLSAASLIVSAVAKFSPLSASIFFPSSTLVPFMRMTIGTGTPNSLTAAITPAASTSQRKMPPKILINTALTFLSIIRMRKAFLICSALAPPPTSRKFAGSPPDSLMMSIVAMASPAPLTMQPMLPSRRM